MKKRTIMKRLSYTLALMLCFSTLAACAASPNQGAVTGKNDGVFEANVTKEASAPVDEKIQFSEVFTSTDGTAEYNVNLNDAVTSGTLPVVEVVPHFLTGEEVQHICEVLFGDADFRENQHESKAEYSKSQLQEKIDFLTKLASEDAITELYGYLDEEALNDVKNTIHRYTVQMETAPKENPMAPCDWTFKNESNYFEYTNGNQLIYATVEHNEVNYNIYALTRDKNDYKQNRITINLATQWYEQSAVMASLCRTEKPTEEQLHALEMKAQETLNQMGLGQWQVCEAKIETTYAGDIPEYVVSVDAAPVLNGVSAIYGQRIISMTGNDVNASNYFISAAGFRFSVNGDLISFSLDSPIDVVAVINGSVATLPVEELLGRAKSHLSLYGAAAELGIPGFLQMHQEHEGELFESRVDICDMKYGLARVKVPDEDFHYYYIPVVVIYGSVEYYGKESGTLHMSSGDYGDKVQPLVWINAVDGSIIEEA